MISSESINFNAHPLKAPYCSIFIVSVALLSYEILLMRLFAIIQWSHFAYMFISLAILGIAVSGTFISIYQKWCEKYFTWLFLISYLLFGISSFSCFYLVQIIPFQQQTLLWSYQSWLQFSLIFILLLIPFFFAANCIVMSLKYFKHSIPAVYGVNLVGSGIGAGLIIILLEFLYPHTILLLISSFAVATLAIAWYELTKKSNQHLLMCIVISVIICIIFSLFQQPLSINHFKPLPQTLQLPQASVILQSSNPQSLIHIVKSPVIPYRAAAGLSLQSSATIPTQLGLFIDANHFSAINYYTENKPDTLAFLADTSSALAYQVVKSPQQLILGLAGGGTLLQAFYHQANHIDIVEPNPLIINIFTNKLANYTGWHHLSKQAQIYNQSFRSFFLAFPDKKYDIIQLDFLDGGYIGSNIYSLAENYNYTVEAIEQYWQGLTPQGVIQFTQWLDLPARSSLKLVNTIQSMLNQQGIESPENHLVLIRSWKTLTILLSKKSLSTDALSNIIRFCHTKGFDTIYFPGITTTQTNKINIIPPPTFHQLIHEMLINNKDFRSAYKFNISATSDNKPFFNHFFKWGSINEFLSLARKGGMSLIETSYLLQLLILFICITCSFLLIIIPLLFRSRHVSIITLLKNNPLTFTDYFLLIGFSFFFLEIAFIQYFILWFDNILIAVTVTTCSFLICSGIGSLLANQLINKKFSYSVLINTTIACILLSLISLQIILPLLLEWLRHSTLLTKAIFATIAISPLALAMGFPFATALASLQKHSDQLIPWAWSINNSASVISILLAPIIAIELGFNSLLLIAACCYLAAAYSFQKFTARVNYTKSD
ncbi:hypothetical protein [Spartinivicinus poritis]|uniref:SAM-dependent methyltransferase n=1 Tax=Spartinivicinus poritis TaxID=2994640 RepID=A0ABT5U4H6_9GAMM|nr:hypothetical protein [Spartinivicinus sp. A2-2]MDE1461222.1 hypothetical protein [Spartinivicinus sp. A2-2]